VLKAFGFREYLKNNRPMLNYQRVRNNLRGFKYLKVTLTEIPNERSKNSQYPSVMTRNQYLAKIGFNKQID